MGDEKQPSRRGWLLEHPFWGALIIAVFSALVLTPVGTLGVLWLTNRDQASALSPAEESQRDEEAKLSRARPGGSLQDLQQTLGVPPAERNSDGRYERVVFILPRSAVLAVTDKSDRVLLVSITSLDPEFKPTFTLADGSSVTLWSTTPKDVAARPAQAMGHIGAHDVYYFEWTYPPSSATNYRQDLYGWAFLVGDEEDTSIRAFDAFFNFESSPRLPGEETFRPVTSKKALTTWSTSPEGADLRRSLRLNTVGFQAANIESLTVFPAALDVEVWPHRGVSETTASSGPQP